MRKIEISLAILFAAAGLLIQFRPLFWHFPPSWISLLATGAGLDYLHLIPIQIKTLHPALYSHDYVMTHLVSLYPWLWRKTSAVFSPTSAVGTKKGLYFLHLGSKVGTTFLTQDDSEFACVLANQFPNVVG